MNAAEKASRMLTALDCLSYEYRGRPDVQHAIGEFLTNMAAPQLALLHDLVVNFDTPMAAADALERRDTR